MEFARRWQTQMEGEMEIWNWKPKTQNKHAFHIHGAQTRANGRGIFKKIKME